MLKIEHGQDQITISLVLRAPSRIANRAKQWTRIWPKPDLSPLLLLLIPAVVLAGDRSVVFEYAGYLDAWFYFSLFRHPAQIFGLFPNTYYGSRMSFILPGYLVHRLLPPLAANYCFHVLVWLSGVAALYVTLRLLAGRRTALLSAMVFGLYPYFWKAAGWDYPDGAGTAYYLITIAALTAAARRQKPSRVLLALAGAACAAAFYCNMVWLMFFPFLPVLWIALRKIQGRRAAIIAPAIWGTTGAVACTVLLALVSRLMGGKYLFYAPSLGFALGQVHAPNPWKAKGYAWVWNAYWLMLPALAVVAGTAAAVRDLWTRLGVRDKLALTLCCNFLYCAAIFVFAEMRGVAVFETFYYASCLIGPMFLFLGARLWAVPEGMSETAFRAIVATTVLVLGLTWWDRDGRVWAELTAFGKTLLLSAAVVAVVGAAVYRATTKAVAAGLCVAAITAFGARASKVVFRDGPVRTENAFQRIVEAGDYCERYREGKKIRFWYGPDKNDQEFASINSLYFYGYSQLGLDFPKMLASVPNLADSVVVVLSTRTDAVQEASRSLVAAGLKGKLLGSHHVARGDTAYTLAAFEFEPSPAGLVNGDFESGISPWNGGWAALQTQDGGQSGKCLALEAEMGSSQFAMQWDALKLMSGKHYRLSFWVKSGSSGDEPFQVGLWDNKQSRWVAYQTGRSSTAWTPYTVAIRNAPADLLSVELMKNSSTKGSMLFDTVALSETQ